MAILIKAVGRLLSLLVVLSLFGFFAVEWVVNANQNPGPTRQERIGAYEHAIREADPAFIALLNPTEANSALHQYCDTDMLSPSAPEACHANSHPTDQEVKAALAQYRTKDAERAKDALAEIRADEAKTTAQHQ